MIDLSESEEHIKEIIWNDGERSPTGHRKPKAIETFRSSRPFIAWDGEGITYNGNQQQCYVLFACSTGDSITAKEGDSLRTERCLDLLLRIEQQFPDAYHIGFGISYDINQILNSFGRKNLYGLANAVKRGRSYIWNGYRIKIHPGKMFRVSKGSGQNFRCVTLYDTFGFFQKRFTDVVKSYFPERISEIEAGKRDRASFKYADIHEITKYCLSENRLLVDIMERLRGNFEERGLYLRDWHGPGAVATASMKKYKIKSAMGEIPLDVRRASRLAYQGGRFELLRAGYFNKPVWQYDINSAYPSAIAELPSLSEGTWEFKRSFEPNSFGVWNVIYGDQRNDRYDKFSRYRAQPLFFRDSYGRISYSPRVEGWYWTPEVENLTNIDYPVQLEIKEGWVFRPSSDRRPFAHLKDIFNERRELKKLGGLGALERVLKLEMNSYYGKFAQRSGWFQEGDQIPTYHCLEWAGYVTSKTRALLWRTYNQDPGAIFAFETDALFSTRPLNVELGNGLGQFSETRYDNILYIQSGFYFANHSLGSLTHSDGSVSHYRGFDKDSVSFDGIMEWLNKLDPIQTFAKNQPKMHGTSKRFIGFKRALVSRKPHYWRTWDIKPRELTIGRDGKRVHMPGCPLCLQNGKKWTEGLHGLTVTIPGGMSQPHKIPWEAEGYIENQWGEEKITDLTDWTPEIY